MSIKKKTHSLLIIGLLTAAADVIDFSDYLNDDEIAKVISRNLTWSLLAISSIQFSFVLTATKKINYEKIGLKSYFLDFFFG